MVDMTTLQEIAWEKGLVEPRRDRELERYARRALGFVPDWVPYFSRCPWIAEDMVAFARSQFNVRYIEVGLAEMIGLVVSQDNACRYCYAATRAKLRILGFPEERIRRIEQDLSTAELNPRDRVALEFARHLSRSNPAPGSADRERLYELGYKEGAAKEIAYVAAFNVFANRVCTLPAIPTDRMERLPDSLMVRLFRPVLAWFFRSRMTRKNPQAVVPELRTGPFSYLVLPFEQLPIAHILRQVVDEAWKPRILTPRVKALVFAVVARTLGSTLAERGASELLLKEGLNRVAVEEILSHLSSTTLDPVEGTILPFARETVWYNQAQIQRRAVAVRDRLGEEQFLELIGVAALANAVCRLEVVAGDA